MARCSARTARRALLRCSRTETTAMPIRRRCVSFRASRPDHLTEHVPLACSLHFSAPHLRPRRHRPSRRSSGGGKRGRGRFARPLFPLILLRARQVRISARRQPLPVAASRARPSGPKATRSRRGGAKDQAREARTTRTRPMDRSRARSAKRLFLRCSMVQMTLQPNPRRFVFGCSSRLDHSTDKRPLVCCLSWSALIIRPHLRRPNRCSPNGKSGAGGRTSAESTRSGRRLSST